MSAKSFEMLANHVFSFIKEERRRKAEAPAVLIIDHLRSHQSEAFRDKWESRENLLDLSDTAEQ
jgi:hypothetical protein